MPRRPRSNLPAYGVFHVTARGVARAPIALDDADRLAWMRLRAEVDDRFGWITYAFCLMGNHYHLVVEAALDRLSRGLHRLNGVYAQRFNARHDRVGHVFQARFDARSIESDDYAEAACAYVLANPVRAGCCRRPGDWPWNGPRP